MKILYISTGLDPDYMCDMLFHGLRTSLGADVVDVPRLYAASFNPKNYEPEELSGRWFTVYGLLPDDTLVDRTDILKKISSRYFDAVVYASVHRSKHFLKEVLSVYPKSRVVFVDGEDCDLRFDNFTRPDGICFKRELSHSLANPIQFAVPAEKIVSVIPEKTQLMSSCDSRNRNTYIYETESDYYLQYGKSYFARTEKRGGWDRVRHYEIMAAGAIPYFEGLEACPANTMTYLPKYELLQARRLHDNWDWSSGCISLWRDIFSKIRDVLSHELTTMSLAKRVLDKITVENL